MRVAPVLVEPDDHAYQASIIGVADGHLLTLSNAQAQALASQVYALSTGADRRLAGPLLIQWTQLPDGQWISQKDPGYPFLAVLFQLLGIIRLAPLSYGLLGCVGLFLGARRWLGRFGGAAAVGLYCSSGAAILFAWRDYMPTFTDASLIAAGTGLLLWAVLAGEASVRRRTWAGVQVQPERHARPPDRGHADAGAGPGRAGLDHRSGDAAAQCGCRAGRWDLAVGLALAASWAAVWILYAAYTWTAFPGLSALASVRFYVPAMAAIALLGAWLITRLPR